MMLSRMMTIAVLAAGLAIAAAPAVAQSPEQINYQGLLSDINGVPLATGTYRLDFSIYDAATGGTLIWGPYSFDGTTGNGKAPKVSVVNGRFNVILGPKDTAATPRDISSAFTSTGARFVEIKVENGTAITPRQQFLSTPYAYTVKGVTFNASGYLVPNGVALNATGDPQAVMTTRSVPSDQSDRTTAQGTNEMTELILFHANDGYNGAGPDYITMRAPSIRLQTYSDATVSDITAKAGSKTRLMIDPDGNINFYGNVYVNGEKPLITKWLTFGAGDLIYDTGMNANTYTCWLGGSYGSNINIAERSVDGWVQSTVILSNKWYVFTNVPSENTTANGKIQWYAYLVCARNEFVNRQSAWQ